MFATFVMCRYDLDVLYFKRLPWYITLVYYLGILPWYITLVYFIFKMLTLVFWLTRRRPYIHCHNNGIGESLVVNTLT